VATSTTSRCAPSLWHLAAILLAAMVLAPWLALPAQARPRAAPEYAVKAAFLYNFAKYVTWPPEVFANDQAPIRLGILGDAPFGNALRVLTGKLVHGRRIEVRRCRSLKELERCQVVFVSLSTPWLLREVLAEVRSRPILTVGEVPAFAREGGIINFVLVDGKVRFEINPTAARRAGIRIHSQLLRIARIVGPAAKGEGAR